MYDTFKKIIIVSVVLGIVFGAGFFAGHKITVGAGQIKYTEIRKTNKQLGIHIKQLESRISKLAKNKQQIEKRYTELQKSINRIKTGAAISLQQTAAIRKTVTNIKRQLDKAIDSF